MNVNLEESPRFGFLRTGRWIYNSVSWYKIEKVAKNELRLVQGITETKRSMESRETNTPER